MANNKTDLFENDLLLYLFNDTALVFTTSYWVALFSTYANTETQVFTEISYAGATPYQRVQKTRTDGTHWTVAGNQVSNATAITFPQNVDTPQTANYAGLCLTTTEGAGDVYWAGDLTSPLVITAAPPITPQFAIGAFVITEE